MPTIPRVQRQRSFFVLIDPEVQILLSSHFAGNKLIQGEGSIEIGVQRFEDLTQAASDTRERVQRISRMIAVGGIGGRVKGLQRRRKMAAAVKDGRSCDP